MPALSRRLTAKFKEDWAHKKGSAGYVKAVYVIKSPALKKSWTYYKRSLPSFHQQVEEYYHGTRLRCNIIRNGDLCSSPHCNVCRISEKGFDEEKIGMNISHFQRFGRGYYLAPQSSKCHEYTQGAFGYRALLLCEVCPGRKYFLQKNAPHLSGPPEGYNSIYGMAGGDLNYDEIVLPQSGAILPKYIIVYEKDDVEKLIHTYP